MKKFFFAAALACAALVSQPVAAQVAPTDFAPVGAEWWYYTVTVGGPVYTHVVSVADSMQVPGQAGSWRLLTRQDYYDINRTGTFSAPAPPSPYVYTQCQGPAVWYAWANTAVPSWPKRLLDFSLPRRSMVDTVWMCQNMGATIEMVDSVGMIGTAGRVLRTQWHSAPTFPSTMELRQYTGRVVEEFGYPNAIIVPLPECGTDPDMPTISYYNGGNGVVLGLRPQGILSVKEAAATRHLSVAPNPSANGRFRLDGLGSKAASYAIYDGQGRQVRVGKLTAADASINLADLPGGLYMLRGEVAGAAFTRRLVRE